MVIDIIIKIIRWNLLSTPSRKSSCKRIQSTDTYRPWVHHSWLVELFTPWPMVMMPLRLGFSVTILVLPTVSRVTKSRSTPLVCITVTTTGHLKSPGTPTTPLRNHILSLYIIISLRRGFKVFQRSCQGCHGAMHQKYDLLVDKGFKQRELMSKMVFAPRIHPAH